MKTSGLPFAGVLSWHGHRSKSILRTIVGTNGRAFRTFGERCVAWGFPQKHGRAAAPPFAFFGRLDNRDELARLLQPEEAGSDADLAQLAWERWGEAAAPRLLGAFVFAAWDPPRQELILGADQMGCETLFTTDGPGYFAFAGHPLPLRACPGVGDGVDDEHFCHWMFTFRTLHDRSFFRGIRRLPPGHLMRVGRGGNSSRPYWRPGEGSAIRFRRDEDYVLAAREMLDRVVAPHLPESGQIAAELSGGLDSGAVVATAARLAPGCRIDAFTTVAEPDAPLPPPASRRLADGDWEGATAVAALHPTVIPQSLPAVGLQPIEADPTGVFAMFGYPILFRETLCWHEGKRAAMAAQGCRVVLTGDGGNYTLSQTGQGLFADLARSGRWLALVREAMATHRDGGRSLRGVLQGYALLPNLPVAARLVLRRLRGGTEPAWREWVSLSDAAVARCRLAEQLHGQGKMRPYESVGTSQAQLLDVIGRYAGKNYSRTWFARSRGLDMRAPLMDVRMIDFTLALPQDQFWRGGVDRWLARRVLADRLPHAVVADRRRHRQCAEWAFRADRSRPYWMAALERLDTSPLARELLDLPRIRALAASWAGPLARQSPSPHREVMLPGIAGGQFLMWAEAGFPQP